MNYSMSMLTNCVDNSSTSKCQGEFSFEHFYSECSKSVKFSLLVFLFFCFITLDVCINLLVLLSICFDKHKKRVDICFMSNAISDLLLGVSIMPFSAVYSLLGYFPFGQYVCFVWNCLDFTVGTSSMLHIAYISYDRYLSVSKPLKYTQRANDRFSITGIPTYLILFFIWFFSAAAWIPFILYFKSNNLIHNISDFSYAENESFSGAERSSNVLSGCDIETTPFIVVPHSFLVYYLPMFLILLFYSKTILIVNKKRKRRSSNYVERKMNNNNASANFSENNSNENLFRNKFSRRFKLREFFSMSESCFYSVVQYDNCVNVCSQSRDLADVLDSNPSDEFSFDTEKIVKNRLVKSPERENENDTSIQQELSRSYLSVKNFTPSNAKKCQLFKMKPIKEKCNFQPNSIKSECDLMNAVTERDHSVKKCLSVDNLNFLPSTQFFPRSVNPRQSDSEPKNKSINIIDFKNTKNPTFTNQKILSFNIIRSQRVENQVKNTKQNLRFSRFKKDLGDKEERKTNFKSKKSAASCKRDRNVTYKLGFIMFTFLFSWFPFCLMWTLASICSSCINANVYLFTFWLAYSNSIFTPFILLYNNAKYRRSIHLLKNVFSRLLIRRIEKKSDSRHNSIFYASNFESSTNFKKTNTNNLEQSAN